MWNAILILVLWLVNSNSANERFRTLAPTCLSRSTSYRKPSSTRWFRFSWTHFLKLKWETYSSFEISFFEILSVVFACLLQCRSGTCSLLAFCNRAFQVLDPKKWFAARRVALRADIAATGVVGQTLPLGSDFQVKCPPYARVRKYNAKHFEKLSLERKCIWEDPRVGCNVLKIVDNF